MTLSTLSDEELLSRIQQANDLYRSGTPAVSDAEYDSWTEELARRDPENPWLHQVEPEPITGKTVKLPERMLSTQKAYTVAELGAWYLQVCKAAAELGDPIRTIRVTPKLDGFAAIDRDGVFATRGDGIEGTDLSHVKARGLKTHLAFGDYPAENVGKGEIVVDREYFNTHLAEEFENTRNVIAAAIKEGELELRIQEAINTSNIVFVPFPTPQYHKIYSFGDWLSEESLDEVWSSLVDDCRFDTDGLVFEVIDPQIKELMGHTAHHYRWQIAYKRNTEFHDCKVTGITWQTARTGRITPVVNIEPTRIGGVTVSNVTGHHAGNILQKGIGEGAVVKVTRAGQVIPHIVEVVSTDDLVPVTYPTTCPSCADVTRLEGDNLLCTNQVNCSAQVTAQIEHFFKTIGDCDGFGPAVVDKLCELLAMNSIIPRVSVFASNIGVSELMSAGVSQGVANNLVDAYHARRQKPLEDWKFLAAFGIPSIGRGVAEKILTKYTLQELHMATPRDLQHIEGVGPILIGNLLDGWRILGEDILSLASRFNLIQTKGTATANSPITGKTVVFTGTMVNGKRSDMEKHAKALGATVASSVSSKTDYLIAGENVGANKTDAAKKHGVTILSEQQYLEMVA